MRPKVFVSYSHRDAQSLRKLLPYLETLRQSKLVDIWIDTTINAGEQWKKEIPEALDAAEIAILIISQHFIASDFIKNEELPRIFEKQRVGRLKILPVFLSPSTVTSENIIVRDKCGKEQRIKLDDFQGFGTPTKTLKELGANERARKFIDLHNRIRELASDSSSETSSYRDDRLQGKRRPSS